MAVNLLDESLIGAIGPSPHNGSLRQSDCRDSARTTPTRCPPVTRAHTHLFALTCLATPRCKGTGLFGSITTLGHATWVQWAPGATMMLQCGQAHGAHPRNGAAVPHLRSGQASRLETTRGVVDARTNHGCWLSPTSRPARVRVDSGLRRPKFRHCCGLPTMLAANPRWLLGCRLRQVSPLACAVGRGDRGALQSPPNRP